MNKTDINKLIKRGILEDFNVLSVYGQEIVDNFLNLVITKLKKNDFKHYNKDFINEKIEGKYYRVFNNKLEIMVLNNSSLNAALDLQYLFSKFIKDVLGIALIEGSRINKGFTYYYGYYYSKELKQFYEIKQNKKQVYLKFNIFNIFYTIMEMNSSLSYLLAPTLVIIPLHQNKSGVLSYANKICEEINFKSYVDDRNISPYEKKNDAILKSIPIIISVGPKELKSRSVIIEFNNYKINISFGYLNYLEDYLKKALNEKYKESMKQIYAFDKEVLSLNNDSKIIKVNLCEKCNVYNYKYFLTPFNRVSKFSKCIICHRTNNNMVLMKK